MNLFTFSVHFGDENACRTHFKSERDNQGVICKKYGHTEHYWKQDKWSYECKSCRFRTSLKSGTIIQHSNLSLLVWYRAMFLISTIKKGFSAKEMQRHLGLKRYESVRAMVHKLRKAMGNRDTRFTLEGMIEIDEDYFTVESSEIQKAKGKRGRGAVA